MPADSQRTEKPTKRRIDKSRREGQFPASRELVAAAQFLALVCLLSAGAGAFLGRMREMLGYFLTHAFALTLTPRTVLRLYRGLLQRIFLPLLWMGGCLVAAELAAQLGSTRLGFSLQNLAPDLKRLNPLEKLRNVPRQNAASFLEALLFVPLLGFAVYKIAHANLATYAALARVAVPAALEIIGDSLRGFLWKAAALFLALGILDFIRIYRHHHKALRMTKLEIRDELKETEGNPQIKQRVRRIQRDLARRNMLREIPKATAVIVNPTHFAVAIRYDMESMAAPKVLAKGKNYLAQRIRQLAFEHEVPIVENAPLAQALYKSADVGQEIPPHLYRAVAEVLAYIYKLMHPGNRRHGNHYPPQGDKGPEGNKHPGGNRRPEGNR